MLDLDPIKARHGAMTSAPWETGYAPPDEPPYIGITYADSVYDAIGDLVADCATPAIAAALVAMRADIAALVAEVEALRAAQGPKLITGETELRPGLWRVDITDAARRGLQADNVTRLPGADGNE